jgi:hypothetical protein
LGPQDSHPFGLLRGKRRESNKKEGFSCAREKKRIFSFSKIRISKLFISNNEFF